MAFDTLQADKICRTCLSNDGVMKSVFSADDSLGQQQNTRIFEMLMSCTSIQVTEGDGLPGQVCLQCVHYITRAFSFKQLCERSDATLRQYLRKPLLSNFSIEKPQPTEYGLLEPKIEILENEEINDEESDEDMNLDDMNDSDQMENNKRKPEDDTEQHIYPCKDCSQCFATLTDLKIHVQAHTKDARHICKVCKQDLASASSLCRNTECKMSRQVEEIQCKPPAIANSVAENLIPQKSQKIYEFAYQRFSKWAHEQNVHSYSENVMLAYFSHLAHKMKSSTLWAQYSMVKAELIINHNIDICKYTKLLKFLKQQSEGYKPKKSKVLTKEQFDDFLHNAPNNIYLATKVIMIFGITGACRCDELTKLTVNDIEDLNKLILVKIRNSNAKILRTFTIMGDYYINLYREYAALRPKDLSTSRFFVKYQNGRCHRAVIGIHKISNVPRDVASYLKLPNPADYTGHCLRRTSATLLVDNEGHISSSRKRRGRKSSSDAEGHIEESRTSKKQTAIDILAPSDNTDLLDTSTEMICSTALRSTETTEISNKIYTATISENNHFGSINTKTISSGLNMQNCKLENCTFNITVNKTN